MKKNLFTLLACLLLLAGRQLQAQEQAALQIKSETLDKQAKTTHTTMYLTANKVLMETEDARKPSTTLYDADKQEMYIIDHKKKEYYVLDKAAMEAMNAQMKQLEQQLQMMPENQRKMLEAQMRKAQGIEEPLTYEQEGGQETVNNWKSSKYVGKSGDRLRHEVYVVPYEELGEDKEDFEALLSLFALLQEQLQQMSSSMPGMMIFSTQYMPDGQEGLPVKSVYYDAQGKPEITSIMTSIEEAAVASDKLQVPQNYKQKQFMAKAE